ncbi:hypothetical protein [Rahnella bruchi]|uniref:hypothetical protein n=1 Tax=Rahnella bruchi TaxID=1510573 RepID=UPI000EA33641|nr:hypothetical protein [Rahnella bruchi]
MEKYDVMRFIRGLLKNQQFFDLRREVGSVSEIVLTQKRVMTLKIQSPAQWPGFWKMLSQQTLIF